MIEGRVVRAIDANANSFRKTFKALGDPVLQREVLETIRSLLFLDLNAVPAKLHLHQLKSRQVVCRLDKSKKTNAWTFHATRDDRYKCSFTFEAETIFLRLVDEHDVIDKNP